jgi:hypothetical protein
MRGQRLPDVNRYAHAALTAIDWIFVRLTHMFMTCFKRLSPIVPYPVSFMKTSQLLARLSEDTEDAVSVGSILNRLGDRSFAVLVVVLGLPNCIPMPPPIPLICALLLIGVALQICLGYRAPWVPAILRNRSLAQKDVKAATAKAIPLLLRLEQFSQPRLQWLGHERAMIAIGLLIMALAFGLLTAAPFIGQIPWGLAVCLVGLGLIERDGMLLLAAIALGALGAVLSASFIYALFITLTTLF